MSCFNALANCCPPPEPPPVECCVELSDIATLFPNGATLVSGNTTFTFPGGGWYKEGCCLRNTTYQTNGGFSRQCTSDWTYEVSESIKCTIKARKKNRVNISFDPNLPRPDLCLEGACEQTIVASSSSGAVTERGERVVTSVFVPILANITVGKYLRDCGYGTTVCTYVVGVSVTYGLYAGAKVQGYKTFTKTIDSVNSEILTYCLGGKTLAQIKAESDVSVTSGTNDFPLCNYIPNEVPPGAPDTLVTVSRVKLSTTFGCPISLTSADNNPDFCNMATTGFCMTTTQEQGPVSVTFNRTLPPVYVAKSLYATGGGLECCKVDLINTFPAQKQVYEVIGPGTHLVGMGWGYDPPPPGEQHVDSCYNDGILNFCTVETSVCFLPPFGCYIPYPDNTIFFSIIQCCEFPQIGPAATFTYHSSEQSDYTFNYSNVTGNTPIVHTYDIPSWTLNC